MATVARQDSEDNQYVAVFNPAAGNASSAAPLPTSTDEDSEYLMMQPAHAEPHPPQPYQNLGPSSTGGWGFVEPPTAGADVTFGTFREQVPAYAMTTQTVRGRISSSDSSTGGGSLSPPSPVPLNQALSPPSSLLDTLEEYSTRQLPAPLKPTSPESHLGPDPVLMRDSPSTTPSHESQAAEMVVPTATRFVHPGPGASPGSVRPTSATLPWGGHGSLSSQQKSVSFDDTLAVGGQARGQASAASCLPQLSPSIEPHSSTNDKRPLPRQRSHDSQATPLTSAKWEREREALTKDFPSLPPSVFTEALERHHGNVSAVREELHVQTLMAMGLAHITPDDCRRALQHCQGKLDRAASWLLEMSSILAAQKT